MKEYRYYRDDSGYIFRQDVETGCFCQLTDDGIWLQTHAFDSNYYERYDYVEISYDEIDIPIKSEKEAEQFLLERECAKIDKEIEKAKSEQNDLLVKLLEDEKRIRKILGHYKELPLCEEDKIRYRSR